jgi:hypothetical protein
MSIAQEAFITGLGLLTLGNPIFLLLAWIQKLNGKRAVAEPKWRSFLLWIALPMSSIAAAAFWAGTQYYPINTVVFGRLLRVSMLTATFALLVSLVGKGPGRKLAAVSALITPFSWFWALFIY